jgi:hypothetical protein
MTLGSVSGVGSAQGVSANYASSAVAGTVQGEAAVTMLKRSNDTQAQLSLQILESGLGAKFDVKG